jgi:uncharacterized integral membrane protein
MQLTFIGLTLLLLVIAVFALQNAAAVTVRFLHWQLEASLALVALSATVAGALIGWLLSLAARLRRWTRAGGAPRMVEPGGRFPPPAPGDRARARRPNGP